jgi:hypothetical protein
MGNREAALRRRLAAWCVVVARLAMRWADRLAPDVPQPAVTGPGRFCVTVTYADGSARVQYRGDSGAEARTIYEGQRTFRDRRVVFTDGAQVRGTSAPER